MARSSMSKCCDHIFNFDLFLKCQFNLAVWCYMGATAYKNIIKGGGYFLTINNIKLQNWNFITYHHNSANDTLTQLIPLLVIQ